MKPTREQTVWLAAGLALLLLSFASVGACLLTLGRTPWAGMQFNPDSRPGEEVPALLQAVPTLRPGAVTQLLLGAPADLAGIRTNDRILLVDGIPTYDLAGLRGLAGRMRVGDTAVYRIQRADETFDVTVRLDSPLQSTGYVSGLVSGFVLAMIFAVIGLVVYLKRLQDRRARLFYVISVLVAVAYLNLSSVTSGILSGTGVSDAQSMGTWIWLLLGVYVLSASLLGALLLHFSMIFPRERPSLRRHPRALHWIYGLPLLHIILGFLAFAFSKLEELFRWERIAEPVFLIACLALSVAIVLRFVRSARSGEWKAAVLRHPYGGMTLLLSLPFMILWILKLVWRIASFTVGYEELFFLGVIGTFVLLIALLGLLVYPIATSVVLYRSYRESESEEKAQLRWPIWGTIFSLCGVTAAAVLSTAITLRGGSAVEVVAVTMDLVQKAFYLLIPLSFAAAILKYRLMDIELILRKTAIYSVVTGTVLLLYLVLAWGLGGLVVRFAAIESEWIIIASTLVIAAVLVPVRKRIQALVDRRFYRERIDYPQALDKISAGVQEASSPAEVARLVAGQVQQAVRSRAVVVFLRRQSGSALPAAAKIGLPDGILENLRIDGEDPVLREGAAIEVVASPEIPEGLRKTLRKTRTALLAPMRRSGEVFGALGVGAKLSGGSFEEDDRQFCRAAAERAAVAVETLLLRRRGQDVDRALEIQRHLLPKELPRIDGYDVAASWQPSGTVAGDYYDVLRLDPGRTGLCIADATGKGMPAALLMSNLQAAVRALAPGAESPSELCRSLNRVLSGSIASGTFFTFFYAELDHGNRSLRYSNAGHNPPILLRRDGTVERLTTGGMVLGAFAGRRYEEREVRIAPGDTLLLFTDGITEAMNASGEEFGEERLLEVMQAGGDLGAEETEAAVMAAVKRFSPGEFGDDATILVLSVRNPGA